MEELGWRADSIEQVPIKKVLNYAKNARLHSEEQVEMLASSMMEFGFVNPCLVDKKGVLIAGHGRVLAAKKIGLETVPVIRIGHLSPTQIEALRLADNRLPEVGGGWDVDLLRDHLKALDGVFDLAIAGFDAVALPQFLADPNAGNGRDPDEYQPTEIPKTCVQPGDLWLLGEHRLICGDATDPAVVTAAIAGREVNIMVTDPPYGVAYDPKWRDRVKRRDGSKVRAKAIGVVQNDTRDDWREAWALFPGNVVYVWHDGLRSATVQASLESAGFAPRAQIIWKKPQFVVGRGDYHWQHECCWYMVRKGKTGSWKGGRDKSTVWDIAAPSGWMQIKEGADAYTGIHSTQKMVECMRRPILNNSMPGDAVYEPFCGSGTTIIACEIEGRHCLAVELFPPYVHVAIERWEKFSGKVARLAATGQTMAELAAERGVKD